MERTTIICFLNYLIIKGKFGKIFSGIVMVEVICKSMVLFLFQKNGKIQYLQESPDRSDC